MPTWEELLKNRKVIPSVRNSGHMLECMKLVRVKFPDAVIEEAGKRLWRLKDGPTYLSDSWPSHYECWLQARMIMEQLS